MSSVNISWCINQWWDQICKKINKAVVFLDDAAAECLHWNGGLLRLLTAGAEDVKKLASFENGNKMQKKAVFITTGLLLEDTTHIIHDIIENSAFQYCIAITSANVNTHYFAVRAHVEDDSIFQQFQDLMLHWMGNMDFTAEVFYIPVFAIPICPNLFVTPTFQKLFPLLQSDLPSLEKIFHNQNLNKTEYKSAPKLSELELTVLPHEIQISIKQFVSCLGNLFEALMVQEDCFSIGHTSRIIAKELASLPSAKIRHKNAQNKVAVLFIDRTLDLTSPCGHQLDTLWDKISQVLPPLNGHHNDKMVDMSFLIAKCHTKNYGNIIMPGCLTHSHDKTAANLLNNFLTSKHKECVMDINRHLVDAITKENLKLNSKASRITPEELSNRVKLFQGNLSAIKNHRSLLQLTAGTVKALCHSRQQRVDDLLILERILLQQIATQDTSSAVNLIIQKIGSYQECGFTFEDILLLLLFVYTLKGTELNAMSEEENKLKTALEEMLLNLPKDDIPTIARSLVGDEFNDIKVQTAVEHIFFILDAVAKARIDLKDIRSVFDSGDDVRPPMLKPFLKQVLDAIFSPDKQEVSDIEYKSSGLKSLIKTGFSLFMNVSKPQLSSYPVIMIYVVGGITSTELKIIKDTVSAHQTNSQVIVGSTQLLHAEDTLEHLFNRKMIKT